MLGCNTIHTFITDVYSKDRQKYESHNITLIPWCSSRLCDVSYLPTKLKWKWLDSFTGGVSPDPIEYMFKYNGTLVQFEKCMWHMVQYLMHERFPWATPKPVLDISRNIAGVRGTSIVNHGWGPHWLKLRHLVVSAINYCTKVCLPEAILDRGLSFEDYGIYLLILAWKTCFW